jgi:hypothetical protein
MGKMRQISVGDKVSLLKGLCYEIFFYIRNNENIVSNFDGTLAGL